MSGLRGGHSGLDIDKGRGNALNQIMQALSALPHGVIKMSADIPSLVETSTNLAVVTTEGKTVSVATSQRSSVASEIDEIVGTVSTIFELARARVEHSDGYPGWKPNIDSPILKTAIATFKALHGREPEVKAVHPGRRGQNGAFAFSQAGSIPIR